MSEDPPTTDSTSEWQFTPLVHEEGLSAIEDFFSSPPLLLPSPHSLPTVGRVDTHTEIEHQRGNHNRLETNTQHDTEDHIEVDQADDVMGAETSIWMSSIAHHGGGNNGDHLASDDEDAHDTDTRIEVDPVGEVITSEAPARKSPYADDGGRPDSDELVPDIENARDTDNDIEIDQADNVITVEAVFGTSSAADDEEKHNSNDLASDDEDALESAVISPSNETVNESTELPTTLQSLSSRHSSIVNDDHHMNDNTQEKNADFHFSTPLPTDRTDQGTDNPETPPSSAESQPRAAKRMKMTRRSGMNESIYWPMSSPASKQIRRRSSLTTISGFDCQLTMQELLKSESADNFAIKDKKDLEETSPLPSHTTGPVDVLQSPKSRPRHDSVAQVDDSDTTMTSQVVADQTTDGASPEPLRDPTTSPLPTASSIQAPAPPPPSKNGTPLPRELPSSQRGSSSNEARWKRELTNLVGQRPPHRRRTRSSIQQSAPDVVGAVKRRRKAKR
ncbi:uncharacterized protein K489DRAFT_413473 [Dissoconium aciculare CBS 342.82]|uniref:Uncharacterized protein n=1 Tax=Dissoconium aciculare CBS 342.82 TaxID=1314786 RepID=A0A6J3LS62_9PEZI|nr:uncharacterized protein K489DRAFT_413473 [Dissoconium aciculare CBS 342.82]KAF1818640.1 hypothetical protein K489DRAFT_413473 [Dissoconium aciculare CBS 342.82]